MAQNIRWKAMPVDFHSHVLPGMDDGSKDAAQSMAMLEQAKQQGTDVMVATPHFYAENETPDSFLKRRAAAAEQLLDAGYDTKKHSRILLGAEVAYFPGIGRCEELASLSIVGTRMILIEMPFRPWTQTMLDDLYSIQINLELIPVLAHIERYPDMRHAAMIKRMIHRGILLQINASMADGYLKRRRALRLLINGDVQLLGSDCHNMTTRQPGMGNMLNYICQHTPQDFIPQMVEFNRFLLQGAVPIEKTSQAYKNNEGVNALT